ncbi:DUF4132 domain-containing protein [Chitinibacter fontanus]|uniref:DUF4132 domain-containing protein n=1 Tax=Chitinibacter fontanus TaxID=1737446 RepID=A0A7D5ZJF8_9NEIS|nr:DUF4132 domain-containing protein [Chitinibacter fontanus]QLI81490.1 DUF4132 domain-containing protein [Chitinibacter fontanus]
MPQPTYPYLRQHWPQVAQITAAVLDVDAQYAQFRSAHPELNAEFRLWADLHHELAYGDETWQVERVRAWWQALDTELGADGTFRWLCSVMQGYSTLRADHPAYANASGPTHDFDETRFDRLALLLEMQQRYAFRVLASPDEFGYSPPASWVAHVLACQLVDLSYGQVDYYHRAALPEGEYGKALCEQYLAGQLCFDDDGLWQPHTQGLCLPVPMDEKQEYLKRRLLVMAVCEEWINAAQLVAFCQRWPAFAPYELLSWQREQWPAAMLPLREALFELLLAEPLQRKLIWHFDDYQPVASTRVAGYRCYLQILRHCDAQLLDVSLGKDEIAALLQPYQSAGLLCPAMPRDTDEIAAAVAQLARYPELVLHALLEMASWSGFGAQNVLLPALGKAHLIDLARQCRQLGLDQAAEEPRGDLAALRQALQALPDEDWELLSANLLSVDLAKLIGALCDKNRKVIEKSAINKHAHIAIQALGVLPLLGDTDCLQRYVLLKELHQLASKYGTERCSNQRESVQIGLANLAANAGYHSLGELEWEMESQQGQALQAFFTPCAIGDYQAQIRLDGDNSAIIVHNAKGKQLASPPAAIKKHPDWIALKEAWDTLKEQRRRFRSVLDEHLVQQTRFSAEQLETARLHPVLYDLISKLVWVDDAGQCGLYQLGQLSGLNDFYDIVGGLRLAHPLEWLQAGTLAAWQQHAVALQLVQPIQQIFRALYVPTPAEIEAGTVSQRYASRWIRTHIAAGIFRQRGWRPTGYNEDAEHLRKLGQGYSAHIDFDFQYHYFTEMPELETREVVFKLHGEIVPITSVPPVLFSEAMRDLDLLLARAIVNDTHEFTSAETVQARHALLQALAPALGGERLRLDERYVHVQGKLANYRINLASAHIHIEPGAYLCVIPDWSQALNKIRLPFEESDARSAEIISKIMLLLDDEHITDQSIVQQIKRQISAQPA